MVEIDADPQDRRRFVVRDGREDIFGGAMSYGNAYISLYPQVNGKPVSELAVHEYTEATYALCGAKPVTYKIWRVEDA